MLFEDTDSMGRWPGPGVRPVDHCYQVLRVLGCGGSGVVYLARYHGPEGFGRLVALKVFYGDQALSEDGARRLRDEARLLGMIDHPGLIRVDRLICLGGRSTISMEYVDGPSLDQLWDGRRPEVRLVFELVAEIASTLDALHHAKGPDGTSLGLVHRDIKPSNVILTREGSVKLLDLGIARAAFMGREAETQELCLGTSGYAAPERLDEDGGPACDVYGLGVVLWELLTGRRLDLTPWDPEAHQRGVSFAMMRLSWVRRDLPELAFLLLRDMLSFEPDDRPAAQDVEMLCRALSEVSRGPALARWARTLPRAGYGGIPAVDALQWVGTIIPEDPPGAAWRLLPADITEEAPPTRAARSEPRRAVQPQPQRFEQFLRGVSAILRRGIWPRS